MDSDDQRTGLATDFLGTEGHHLKERPAIIVSDDITSEHDLDTFRTDIGHDRKDSEHRSIWNAASPNQDRRAVSPENLIPELVPPDKSVSGTDEESRHRTRVVHFGAVHVQEHALTIGDHPWCKDSLPLTLDWEHSPERTYSVNAYELLRHRRKKCRRRNTAARRDMLRKVSTHSSSETHRTGTSSSGREKTMEVEGAKEAKIKSNVRRTEVYDSPEITKQRRSPLDFATDHSSSGILFPLDDPSESQEVGPIFATCDSHTIFPPSPTSVTDHTSIFGPYVMSVQILEE